MANAVKKFLADFEDINEYYTFLVDKTKRLEYVGITNEWLIDNFYLLVEHKTNIIHDKKYIVKDFASLNHIAIEIPRLTKLINIAEQFNGAAKTSGAGNGDCGIVIADEKTDIEEMKNNWRKNGIMPLNFLVHSIA